MAIVNEEVSYKRMINCTNAVGLRNIETCLHKLDINDRIKLVIFNRKFGRGAELPL
jgi:hypothetical protein